MHGKDKTNSKNKNKAKPKAGDTKKRDKMLQETNEKIKVAETLADTELILKDLESQVTAATGKEKETAEWVLRKAKETAFKRMINEAPETVRKN